MTTYVDQSAFCQASVERRFGESPQCGRTAQRLVGGRVLCWQHAEMVARPWNHWELEDRELAAIDVLAPAIEPAMHWTFRLRMWLYARLGWRWWALEACGYCGRVAWRGTLVVNPRTLQRYYERVCKRRSCVARLRAWEGAGQARRARAHADWEQERGVVTPQDLTEGIPPQYPSISRATLRAFLESGLESATVAGGSAVALNSSIRSLGFADQVYAEVRSGEAALRRVGPHQSLVSAL